MEINARDGDEGAEDFETLYLLLQFTSAPSGKYQPLQSACR
jgi:hypothetical protein